MQMRPWSGTGPMGTKPSPAFTSEYEKRCKCNREFRFSGRKKEPKPPTFLVRMFSSGVGVFHVNGWGAKKFDMSLKTREIKLFGDIGILPGHPGGARKV